MLNFNLRIGDDVWFGKKEMPLHEWQQMILKSADDQYLTVFTPTEVLGVEYDDEPMDSGVLEVKIAVKRDAGISGQFTFGMEAPSDVKIMRGRVYRRELDG
jgi:hypothetical protein